MTNPTFVSVTPGQDGVMRLMLEVAQLPTDDLDQPGRSFFRMADRTGVIGYVGLEGTGPDRLLRSLVVLPSRRAQGHGAALVARLEELARHDEARRLHLLTRSSRSFFRRLGYADADRTTAPAVIAGTAQFTSLCPSSAAYLVKTL